MVLIFPLVKATRLHVHSCLYSPTDASCPPLNLLIDTCCSYIPLDMGNTSSSDRPKSDNGSSPPLATPPAATLDIACGPGEIERPSAPPLPDSDKPTSRGDQTFALTIGINTYESKTFESETLQGAVNDANKFDEYLCEDLGTPKENIISLRNEHATRSRIIHGFRSLEHNPKIVRGKAAIIIYYAGHGAVATKPVEWKDWETPDDKIEMLCPYDIGCQGDNDEVVDGIPDRTISQLLLDLSTAKGNNITLILDCCHAAGINRGGGVGGSIDLEAGRMEVRTRTFRNVQNLSPACDEDIYSARESGLSGSLRDSHVLLAACRRSQTASEINGNGIFTDALLRCMKDKPLTPHFDGKHIRRRLFDSWESPADSSMILCRREEDCLVLSAGSLHGITVRSTFAIYGTDLSDPHHPLATAVVNAVEPFVSYLPPPDKDFFTTYKDHPVWYARLDKASGSNIAIYCNSSDFLHNILTEASEPMLTVTAVVTETQPEADLCLTVEGSTVYFDRGDKNSIISASMGFPSRFSSSIGVKDIARIRRVIDRYSQFNSQLTRPGSLPISDYISIQMHELKTDKGRLSPTGDNILPDGEEKPVEFVIDPSSQEKCYGFTIRNTSTIALYAYLFYFDASTLEIEEWYSPDLGNGKKNSVIDTCLQPGSTVTLGFGSGGMEPVKFFIPDGQGVDLCFFKIFVTTNAVDLGSISQLSPFTESIGRGAIRVRQAIKDDWGSRIIPIVLRRAQTLQSPSVPSSSSYSEKGSTKPAEDYMYGLEKWLIASLQRLERFLFPLHQSYTVPNEALESGRSEWEKN
ncbi:caspase domain-containing protein [Armillaria borealis]|uniref:Caspase domain-containing protein n=1 Tax=Armillaria borealis TaxID=47425 RepID=A0AA39JZG4_9AGAR|nr:caspase domain-containing protein [Armillaria borealis]